MSNIDTTSRLTRIGSMMLDHWAMSIIVGVVMSPVIAVYMFEGFNTNEPPIIDNGFGVFTYWFSLAFAIYFCKDSIEGRSPAKLLTKLQVVNSRSGNVAGPIRCCIRNFTSSIWPIEVVITFFSPQRRLGDLIAGTRTIQNPELIRKPPVYGRQIFAALAVGYLFSFMLFKGMEWLFFRSSHLFDAVVYH